jgi:hypothetical protein
MMAGAPYSNVAAALITIVRTEGSTALFNGVWLSLLKQGPSMAITFATYEVTRSLLTSCTPPRTVARAVTSVWLACADAQAVKQFLEL